MVIYYGKLHDGIRKTIAQIDILYVGTVDYTARAQSSIIHMDNNIVLFVQKTCVELSEHFFYPLTGRHVMWTKNM